MQIFKWLVYLCVLPCMVSCAESEKERLSRLVKEWERKEVLFPPYSTFTIQGKDTVNFEFKDADYKVVTYIDSVGCTSCKLQLHRWKEYIAEVDSLTDGRVPFLFYFHPKDMKELRYLTRRDNFTYPVCLDERDELNRLNQFPSDMTFQTFLLDKENKVVAIGNPILNPKVKELYLKIVTGSRSEKLQGAKTQVSVNHAELDFGSFPKTEKQERSFVLTNTGTGLLVVHDVTTSCGCTKVKYNKQPVRPGETLELKVTYEAEETGHFNKTLRVYCNADNSPLRLTVKGNAN